MGMTPGFWLEHLSARGYSEHDGAGCSVEAAVFAVERTSQGQLRPAWGQGSCFLSSVYVHVGSLQAGP